jgi:hypothetical protein
MANFFSLQDGNLTDASVYGYSLTGAEVMTGVSGVSLGIVDAYGPLFTGDGSTISAVAVHLSARQANNTTDNLILKLSSAASVRTEYYPISNFTSYDGSNNLLASYPLNWQILKLSTGYQIPNLSSAKISLAATTGGVISLIGAASNNFDKAVIASTATIPTSNDNLHLGGSIKLSAIEIRTITANTSSYQNLYVHNQGTLLFPTTASKTLTLNGSVGLQITSDGTLNIGTSLLVIPLSTTHTINLSNTQIDVHNGGNFNVYGYPKLFTTNLVNDTISASNTFITADNVSNIWKVGDILTFKPSLSFRTGFDTLYLSGFTSTNTFKTSTNSIYTHTGLATYANIAGIYNLSRNVVIQGSSSINRGTIRTIDAAKTSINYASLSNFGINATNKTGFIFGNKSNGSTTLSGVVINSDNTSTVNNIAPLTGRTFQNITINNSIFFKSNILALSALTVNNININNNYILSSGGIALQMNNLSGSISMSNNTTIGSLSYGTYLANNTLTGTYGANNFNSLAQGMYIAGTNTGTIVGGGLNSAKEGVYVDASTGNLSAVTFQNILANNNTSVGFKVSGNSLNYLTPVTLNINGLAANNNLDTGIEAYNICGNISGITSNSNNLYNIKTSIGNGNTIFDGLSSINTITNTITSGITTTGSPAASSISGYTGYGRFYGQSNAGVNYYNYTGSSFISDIATSGSNFTIEAWVYVTSYHGLNEAGGAWDKPQLITFNDSSLSFGLTYTGKVCLWKYLNPLGGGERQASSTNLVPLNVWTHIACVVSNSSIYLYINGVLQVLDPAALSNPIRPTPWTSFAAGVGTNVTTSSITFGSQLNGYVRSARIVKDIAVYSTTSNFTPPIFLKNITGTTWLFNNPNYYLNANTSFVSNSINILSAYNYNQTVFKNVSVINPQYIGDETAFNLSVNKLEDFRLENSTLSAVTPLSISSTRSVLEGSYTFHNCNSDTYGLSTIATTQYQSDVFTETGFSVMRENGVNGKNYRQLDSGSIEYDLTVMYNNKGFPSEKLTPMDSLRKLRSGSKIVPLDAGDSCIVGVYVKKSSSYTGAVPRLILKSNVSMGYTETVLDTMVVANNTWENLTGSIPSALVAGMFEVYVDCSGSIGSGSINIDSWSLT